MRWEVLARPPRSSQLPCLTDLRMPFSSTPTTQVFWHPSSPSLLRSGQARSAPASRWPEAPAECGIKGCHGPLFTFPRLQDPRLDSVHSHWDKYQECKRPQTYILQSKKFPGLGDAVLLWLPLFAKHDSHPKGKQVHLRLYTLGLLCPEPGCGFPLRKCFYRYVWGLKFPDVNGAFW